MLMAVVMADKATFDGLWAFAKRSATATASRSWHLNADGSTAFGRRSERRRRGHMAWRCWPTQWGGGYATTPGTDLVDPRQRVSSSNVFLPDDSGNQSTDVNPRTRARLLQGFQTATASRWGLVADQTHVLTVRERPTGLGPTGGSPRAQAAAA
jgi:hypothetical protein